MFTNRNSAHSSKSHFIINLPFQAPGKLILFQVTGIKVLLHLDTHSSGDKRKSQSQNRWDTKWYKLTLLPCSHRQALILTSFPLSPATQVSLNQNFTTAPVKCHLKPPGRVWELSLELKLVKFRFVYTNLITGHSWMTCCTPGPCCPHSPGKTLCSHWKHSLGGGVQCDFRTAAEVLLGCVKQSWYHQVRIPGFVWVKGNITLTLPHF